MSGVENLVQTKTIGLVKMSQKNDVVKALSSIKAGKKKVYVKLLLTFFKYIDFLKNVNMARDVIEKVEMFFSLGGMFYV